MITPYMEYIRDLLKKANIQATVIYEKLLEKGACMSLSTVSRAVKSIKHELDISAIRYETTPGQQARQIGLHSKDILQTSMDMSVHYMPSFLS